MDLTCLEAVVHWSQVVLLKVVGEAVLLYLEVVAVVLLNLYQVVVAVVPVGLGLVVVAVVQMLS